MEWRLLDHEFAEGDFGFNVVGFISGSMGLGVAARNTVRSMADAGIRMRVVDLDLGDDRSGHDLSCVRLGEHTAEPDAFPVSLFHVNPIEIKARATNMDFVDRFNLCVPFWELTVLPPNWVKILRAMDVVLAPTQFIHEVVQNALPDCLCIRYPQAVLLPDDVEPDKERWGFSEDAVIFIAAFDVGSDIARKNPWAAIDAFERAFPKGGNQHLVLKVNAPEWTRQLFRGEVQRLYEVVAGNDHIHLVDAVLPFRDVLSLYASSDVLVSLHRSEGLGLHLMEALSLGKPVIATAWSGNMDYTTDENSCLVGYRTVPVISEHPSYDAEYVGGEPVWAEPDVEEAAEYMKQLAENPELRLAKGAVAAADMIRRREEYARCDTWSTVQDLVFDRGSEIWSDHHRRIDLLTQW